MPSFLNQCPVESVENIYACEVLLSENSCARNICHILLTGYEDVPYFLNQWKLYRTSSIAQMIKMKTYLVYTG